MSNYRPVTIISVLSQLFEACVNRKIKDKLSVCVDYKYVRYVSERGHEKSLNVLSAVVKNFLKGKTEMLMVILDTSAAFGKVYT